MEASRRRRRHSVSSWSACWSLVLRKRRSKTLRALAAVIVKQSEVASSAGGDWHLLDKTKTKKKMRKKSEAVKEILLRSPPSILCSQQVSFPTSAPSTLLTDTPVVSSPGTRPVCNKLTWYSLPWCSLSMHALQSEQEAHPDRIHGNHLQEKILNHRWETWGARNSDLELELRWNPTEILCRICNVVRDSWCAQKRCTKLAGWDFSHPGKVSVFKSHPLFEFRKRHMVCTSCCTRSFCVIQGAHLVKWPLSGKLYCKEMTQAFPNLQTHPKACARFKYWSGNLFDVSHGSQILVTQNMWGFLSFIILLVTFNIPLSNTICSKSHFRTHMGI